MYAQPQQQNYEKLNISIMIKMLLPFWLARRVNSY